MYFGRWVLDGKEFVQARVKLECVGLAWPRVASGVFATLAIAVLPETDVAVRVATYRGELSMAWAFTVPAEEQSRLERLVALLTRLERYGAGFLEVGADAAAFDAMFGGTPRVRSRVVCEGLSRDGLAFACDMRLIEELDIIIADAVTRQARFVYQAHIAHLQPAPSVLREARVNASRIRAHRGVPAPVARRQEFMAARLQQACAVTEEFVATDPAHGAWLGDHLRRVLTEQNGDLGVDGAALAPAMDAYEDELATGLHQSRLVGLPFDSVVSQAIDETTLSRIAAWAPGASLASLLALAVDPDDGAPSPRGLAAPASPQAPRYLFVSYAHADTPRVEAIIRTAARAGISLWWDAHIPGGSEWDEHLETRIRESAGVVLFLSSSAVASKYVRREVKFADLVGKRIFSVELEPRVELTHGLAMLLTQYQRLSADRPDLLDHLRSGASPA